LLLLDFGSGVTACVGLLTYHNTHVLKRIQTHTEKLTLTHIHMHNAHTHTQTHNTHTHTLATHTHTPGPAS